MCPPRWSVEFGHDGTDDGDETKDNCKICSTGIDQFKKDNPNSPWFLSAAGERISLKLENEMNKREPSQHRRYFYNDFANDGFVEVVENQLRVLDKEFTREPHRPMYVWNQLEGLGLWLRQDSFWLSMYADGQRAEALLSLIGSAVIHSFGFVMVTHGYKRKPDIRNLVPIVMAFVEFARDFSDYECTTEWRHILVYLLHTYGKILNSKIDTSIVKDWETMVEEATEFWEEQGDESNEDDSGDEGDAASTTKAAKKSFIPSGVLELGYFGWAQKFQEYSDDYGAPIGLYENGSIGGKRYDITKMPKYMLEAERRRFEPGFESDEEDSD